MFVETPFVRKKHRRELLAKCVFGLMAAAMVVPLVMIISYLVYQGAPLISWEFLTTNPVGGMRRGGIWSALLGTIWLVGVSLLIAAPIGVLAAGYLKEKPKAYCTRPTSKRACRALCTRCLGLAHLCCLPGSGGRFSRPRSPWRS